MKTIVKIIAITAFVALTLTSCKNPLEVFIDKTTPTLETPYAWPQPGTYSGPVQVALRCDSPSGDIYYTLDGSTPNAGSTSYRYGPITVSTTTTIKAIAIGGMRKDSAVMTAVYIIEAP